jgi:sterol desaturase/sphingolipid hydroxylase (fatty acid hydroxylase superfamily)
MVECNFGENYAPFDYFFGTFAATEEDAVALREARNERKRKFKVALNEAESTPVGQKSE